MNTKDEKSIIKNTALNDDVIPDKVLNPHAIIDSLEHDKPQEDSVLEKISGIIDVECELNAVELKKSAQIRKLR